MMNRLANCKNPYQGKYKKVLCVCSAGLLRSPTAAWLLTTELGYNTRAAGIVEEYALIPVDRVLLEWADEIVCMDATQERNLQHMLAESLTTKPVVCLHIPDNFEYRDPKLVELIRNAYKKHLEKTSATKS